MKKYTTSISKLYESVGFEKIEKGKTYTTSRGAKIVIDDIYIDATQEIPDVYVTYTFENLDGNTGSETNRFSVVVDILRSK
jgi:hypothetical protein